jgi:hypothetical protein
MVSGPETTNYLAAEPNGSVTMNFSSQKDYLGLLWGSVDTFNTVSLYDGTTLVGHLTGSQVMANANGNQGINGSDYRNIDTLNGVSFNRAVFSSTSPAFEFWSVSTSSYDVPINGTSSAPANATSPVPVALESSPIVVLAANPAPLPGLGSTAAGLVASLGWLASRRRKQAVPAA